jgi:uroporphyrin-III C-methyltransferase
MTVYLVGAGPGDPELMTIKAARLLRDCDVVVHDRLGSEVMELCPPHVRRIDVGKAHGQSHTQVQINALLVELGAAGLDVVRLKGGDPYLFGRGGEEAQALSDAGIAWEVVPGVTSALSLPALAGVPVTHRSLSDSVTVLTGHRIEGWDTNVEALAAAGGTLVIVMGVANRGRIAERLMTAGMNALTPVCVIERGSTVHEHVIRTSLSELGTIEVESPAVIVVGAVAGLDLTQRFVLSEAPAATATDVTDLLAAVEAR